MKIKNKLQISLFELVMCLSDAIDMVSPLLCYHQKQVAIIAFLLVDAMNLGNRIKHKMIVTGALHDIGALSLKERLDLLSFDVDTDKAHRHAELGYRHLKSFHPFEKIAKVVRSHHRRWDTFSDNEKKSEHMLHANMIFLADRVAISINKDKEILGQRSLIKEMVNNFSGSLFNPDFVGVFNELSAKESFWFLAVSNNLDRMIPKEKNIYQTMLNHDSLVEFARLFGRVIDFRSSYTAVHSFRVSYVSELLARYAGMSEEECFQMKIAGYLHDLGKLAVSTEILEKQGKLSIDEMNIMKSHVFHTYRLLSYIDNFKTINSWASAHHERIDGKGYSFHLTKENFSKGGRILAVADVFTALTENRPYRKGIIIEDACKIMQDMTSNALDKDVVTLVWKHRAELQQIRIHAEQEIQHEYSNFIKGV